MISEPLFLIEEQLRNRCQVRYGKPQHELLGYHMDHRCLCLLAQRERPWWFVEVWGLYLLGWFCLALIAYPIGLFWVTGTSSASFGVVVFTQLKTIVWGLLWLCGFVVMKAKTSELYQQARRWYPEWLQRLTGKFPSPDLLGAVVISRQTGTIRCCHWHSSLIIPFSEVEGRIVAHYGKHGVTYSVDLIHCEGTESTCATLNRLFDQRKDAMAYWEFVKRYMNPDEPLPDVPFLEVFRGKDLVTVALDRECGRRHDHWARTDATEWLKSTPLADSVLQRFLRG